MQAPVRTDRAVTAVGRYPTGAVIAVGFVTVVLGCLVVALVVPPPHATVRLILLALVVGGFAAMAGDRAAALATALLSFPFYLGFLVDRHGDLVWHGPVDLLRLAVLVGAAVAATILGARADRRNQPAEPGGAESGV